MPEKRTYSTTVRRVVKTDLKHAWAAWADAAQLSHWFTTNAWQDFRVGGRYQNPDGDSGAFLEIVPNRLIRFTWENKRHHPGSEVSVGFSEQAGGTTIHLRHSKLKTKKDAANLEQGWSWAMDSLKSYLETGQPIRHEDWLKKRKKRVH